MSRIIRRAEVERENILPLTLRYSFPLLPESSAGESENSSKNNEAEKFAEEKMAEARADYEEIVRQAQAEAEQIIKEAQERAQAIAQNLAEQAEKEGYKKGYESGYREAIDKAKAEAKAIRQEADSILKQAEKIWQNTLETMESDIISLAREIAEKILATQLTMDPQVMLAIVRESLELVRERRQVLIYVNPEEVSFVQQRKEELQQVLLPDTKLYILDDASIERGGCRVETEDSKIEATLTERWQVMHRLLQT